MVDAGQPTSVTAWVWGGGLLIASALLPLVASASLNEVGNLAIVGGIGIAAFSAALLLFAYGWRSQGSVVARRPLGTTALTVWASVGPLSAVISLALPAYDAGSAPLFEALYYGELLVWLGAGLVAIVAIARAGVVPRPWNRAPLWAFGIVVGAGVLFQAAIVGVAGRPDGQEALGLLTGILSLVSTLVPLLLGILAIVLGLRTAPRPVVQVYPPEPPA